MKKGDVKYLGAPIKMAKIAENKVWMMNVPAQDFEKLSTSYAIIHHMKDGDTIRCRCLADEQPAPGAKQVKANLEDAYLYLLAKDNIDVTDINR